MYLYKSRGGIFANLVTVGIDVFQKFKPLFRTVMNWYGVAEVIFIERINDGIYWIPTIIVVGIGYILPRPIYSLIDANINNIYITSDKNK
jgi:hypothetical protein